MINDTKFPNLQENIIKEKKILKEMNSLFRNLEQNPDSKDKKMIESQINSLKNSLNKTNQNLLEITESIILPRTIKSPELKKTPEASVKEIPLKKKKVTFSKKIIKAVNEGITEIEKKTLQRILKKKEKVTKKIIKKPNKYIKVANKLFNQTSKDLSKEPIFKTLEKDLIKANLQFLKTSYISVTLLTTILSLFVAFGIFIFYLFFNFGPVIPFITRATEDIMTRAIKFSWILIVMPIITFLGLYLYPSLEKKSLESKINQELPFATIHMSAISGSMIDPTRIFTIILATKEYPNLQREFTKLINSIHIYGYNLVSALRNSAMNSPSKKLAELFQGLATTISSGGDLPRFFDKRAQSLLFDYRIEREKQTKSAETFMDIYISTVIAAPMILMLLLMMMKISGLGVSLSTSLITIIMVLGVSVMNIAFLTFLQLQQKND